MEQMVIHTVLMLIIAVGISFSGMSKTGSTSCSNLLTASVESLVLEFFICML